VARGFRSCFVSSCTGIPGGLCSAVRFLVPDASPTLWLSHLPVRIAAAARAVQDTDGLGRRQALGGRRRRLRCSGCSFSCPRLPWDDEAANAKLAEKPATAPSVHGALVIDDTGNRKVDNGIVALTTLWAEEKRYDPQHVALHTPDKRLLGGKRDPAFAPNCKSCWTWSSAQAANVRFCAIAADCFCGDNHALEAALLTRCLPHVLARRGALGRCWAPVEADHSFKKAACSQPLHAWHEIICRFWDGYSERWWAAEFTLFDYGPGRPVQAICGTTEHAPAGPNSAPCSAL